MAREGKSWTMRLLNYINENSISVEEAVEMIKDDCAPYFKLAQASKPLYRGTEKLIADIATIFPRKDRKPKDIPREFHDYLDKELQKKFGWKPRSEGVFATSDILQAEAYGKSYLFFPIGDFKFIWSPDIRDLYIEMANILEDGRTRPGEDPWTNVDKEYLRKDLLMFISTYINKNLKEAINSWHEMIFKCASYYLVNTQWLTRETQDKSYSELFK
jgi:hypothetical protein